MFLNLERAKTRNADDVKRGVEAAAGGRLPWEWYEATSDSPEEADHREVEENMAKAVAELRSRHAH